MESTLGHRTVTKRPGGRTAYVTARVHQAVLDLLIEGGAHACTFKSVAERAGVERSTLYRRYPDRWEMVIDAFMAVGAADVVPDRCGSFARDLRSVLKKLAAMLATPLGPAVVAAAAELRAGSGGDFSRAYFVRRMNQLRGMFDAAVMRGELPPETDRETLFTFAAGPIYFRLFIAARPIDDSFIDSIVDTVCTAFGVESCPKAPAFPRLG
ncbi:MAG: TetR/AcrR family transcriptional regulator C-terminal ligand-binding domain-containing protein [Pseudomonadota bacterium]